MSDSGTGRTGQNEASIRPFTESDLPQVADLYWHHMRQRKGPAPPAVHASLHELYFANPWVDSELPSVVYLSPSGQVVGFLGLIVRKMCLKGQPIRIALAGNMVVHSEFRSKQAATRLAGVWSGGKHDISLGDSCNDASRRLLERIDFRTIPALNIHWARPLRPSHYAVYAISHRTGPMLSASLKLAAKPLCSLADAVAEMFSKSPFRHAKSPLHGAEADVETLLECFAEFRQGYSLWPEYDARSLAWLLSFMERRTARGHLRKVVVRDDRQKIVGWYIYYVKPGAVGEVVQVGGEPKFTKDVLDHLFYDARERGVIALHGVVERRRMPDFSDKGCFFTCLGGWTLVHTRQPELLELLERGDVLLSRLDGEWCLDPGE